MAPSVFIRSIIMNKSFFYPFAISCFLALSFISYQSIFDDQGDALVRVDQDTSLENKMLNQALKLESEQGVTSAKDAVLKLKTFRLTDVDGQLKVDAQGQLIIDRDLRHWIDFYLSAVGEISLEDIIALMKSEINKLSPLAKAQALELLESYIGYKSALAEYDEREALGITDSASLAQIGERLQWQKRLRRQWLPDEAVEEFWQLDELVDDYTYEKLVIKSSTMTAAEKKEQLLALDNSLPNEIVEFKKSLTLSSDLLEQEKALSEQGKADEIRELRAQNMSPEAVERLETLDQQQLNWHKKVMAYRDEMAKVENIEGMSRQDKDEILDAYQASNFTDREKLRLPAAIKLVDEN